MPKRIGFLYGKFISTRNCVLAEKNMAKNKRDNKMAVHIGENAERYGKALSDMLKAGTWVPAPNREITITDSYKGKTRLLKIPCLLDQSVQYAWLNVACPYIERRNYFYNCGSIPKAGQTRAVRGLKKWLGKKKRPPRYGAVTDIRKFYDTCPHAVVMRALRRIFKDKRFLDIAARILASMSETGVGLAIGHPSSHWFANLALLYTDHELRERFPDVKFARYMDDTAFVSNNKRHIRGAVFWLMEKVKSLGMEIKNTWQVFRVKERGVTFLSYRFFHGYTILVKPLMYRISRAVRRAARRMTLREARVIVNYYYGILKWCDSYNFKKTRVYPYISPSKCKEVISHEERRIFAETRAD